MCPRKQLKYVPSKYVKPFEWAHLRMNVPPKTGVELRPFFTKILAWTTFVHFSNPGAKNPSLDAILEGFPPEAVKPGFCSRFNCHCD